MRAVTIFKITYDLIQEISKETGLPTWAVVKNAMESKESFDEIVDMYDIDLGKLTSKARQLKNTTVSISDNDYEKMRKINYMERKKLNQIIHVFLVNLTEKGLMVCRKKG